MNFNEIAYLLLGLVGGIFFCWFYFKYKLRNMPSVQVLLHRSQALHQTMRKAIEGQKALIKNREEELDSLLSKSLEDSKDTLH